MTVPTLQVLLDDGTGTFPFDITSFVMADGYDITRGRDDWQGAVTTGELNLTLNNSDGRFSPGSLVIGGGLVGFGFDVGGFDVGGFGGGGGGGGGLGIGGFGTGGFGVGGGGGGVSGSLITVDRQIRLIETVDGDTFVRFTGYIKAWPVSWPAVVPTFATVQLTATDAQARAERRTLRSMLEEEILALGPLAYYTLGEPSGSTSAGDTSGNQALPLAIAGTGSPVVFGNGTGPVDGLPAMQFFGGQYLQAQTIPSFGAAWTVSQEFATTAIPTGFGMPLMDLGVIAPLIDSTGILLGKVVNDGSTHMLTISNSGAGLAVYIDAALVLSSAALGSPTSFVLGAGGGLPAVYTGTMSHVAVWPSALTSTDVTAIYNQSTGSSEPSTARITRLATYAGVPIGDLDDPLTDVPAQATADGSAQDALQVVNDAEAGLLFIDGTGELTFYNRGRVSSKGTPDLTLDAQYLTTDVQPVLDDQHLVNYVEVTAAGTGGVAVAHDEVSELIHGRYPESNEYLVETDAEAQDRANWLIAKLGEPQTRYGTLTVNLYKMTATQANAVLAALDLDCWLRVTSMASQNPDGPIADVVVQGWHETASPASGSWSIACNVVSRSLYTALILDDAVFGALDSYPILF